MTPAELAKITKVARDLGFTNQEVDACGGDQAALLALFASACSQVSANGREIVYGARQTGRKKVTDVDDHITKLTAKAAVKVTGKAM